MGRLIVSANVTLDMIMDQLEGWFDPTGPSAPFGLEQLRAADAILLGREGYEFLSEFWPGSESPYAELINPIPKHVASRTLEGPLEWNARLLEGEASEAVAALKETTGQLLLYGCGELASTLARAGLVDEVRLWIHPVVWGDGTRTFAPGTLPAHLRLLGARTFPGDVVQLSYAPVASEDPAG